MLLDLVLMQSRLVWDGTLAEASFVCYNASALFCVRLVVGVFVLQCDMQYMVSGSACIGVAEDKEALNSL